MNLCQIGISDPYLYILRSASERRYFRRLIEEFPLRRLVTCIKHQMEQRMKNIDFGRGLVYCKCPNEGLGLASLSAEGNTVFLALFQKAVFVDEINKK